MRNTLQRALTAVSLTLLTLQASIGSAADLLVSGTIYTADDEAPTVEAVIIRDGRFNYVGTLEGALKDVAQDHQRLELASRVAYPGFIESHGHLSSLGEAITNLALNGAHSYQTIVGMVADAHARGAPGQEIKGRGWHQSRWNSEPKTTLEGFPTHRSL